MHLLLLGLIVPTPPRSRAHAQPNPPIHPSIHISFDSRAEHKEEANRAHARGIRSRARTGLNGHVGCENGWERRGGLDARKEKGHAWAWNKPHRRACVRVRVWVGRTTKSRVTRSCVCNHPCNFFYHAEAPRHAGVSCRFIMQAYHAGKGDIVGGRLHGTKCAAGPRRRHAGHSNESCVRAALTTPEERGSARRTSNALTQSFARSSSLSLIDSLAYLPCE